MSKYPELVFFAILFIPLFIITIISRWREQKLTQGAMRAAWVFYKVQESEGISGDELYDNWQMPLKKIVGKTVAKPSLHITKDILAKLLAKNMIKFNKEKEMYFKQDNDIDKMLERIFEEF